MENIKKNVNDKKSQNLEELMDKYLGQSPETEEHQDSYSVHVRDEPEGCCC